jgi:putative MATE family efflux protein
VVFLVENNGQIKENKMGTMPVNKLLLNMAIPMILSMLVQALYNIVDSIYVSHLSENALTAVSLAFPIQSLIIAVGTGIATGLNAMLSKALGEKNQKDVNDSARSAMFLAVCAYVIMLIASFTIVKPYFNTQTTDAEIFSYGTVYLSLCLAFSFGIYGQLLFERMLVSTGKTMFSMTSQLVGAIINIILDPILIFGYFGLPKMGTAGAAIATVIGQVVAFGVAVFFNIRFNKEIHFKLSIRPTGTAVRRILAVGIPSTLMQAVGSVMTTGMNMILMSFTPTATAVFGIYFKLQSFFFMPIFGLNSGIVPIIAYNYGARNKERLVKAMKLGFVYAVGFMWTGCLVFETIPQVLFKLFDASDNMLGIGVPALRIMALAFLAAGFCIMCGTIFQALGNGVYSMIVSFARQLIVLLPAAYLLSLTGSLNAVWWAFPIAEVASLACSLFFLFRIYNKIIKPLGE